MEAERGNYGGNGRTYPSLVNGALVDGTLCNSAIADGGSGADGTGGDPNARSKDTGTVWRSSTAEEFFDVANPNVKGPK